MMNSLYSELFTAAPADQSNLYFQDFQSNGHKHTKLSYHYWIKLSAWIKNTKRFASLTALVINYFA